MDPVARFGEGFCRYAFALNLRSFRGQTRPRKRAEAASRTEYLANALGIELPDDLRTFLEERRAKFRRRLERRRR